MASTASCGNLVPFPQSPLTRDIDTCSPSNILSNNGVRNDYYYNNNHARARIVVSPSEIPEDVPQLTPEQIQAQQAQDKARQQAYIAKVQRDYWLSSVSADISQIYADVLGRPMPEVVRSEIAAMIAAGIDKTLIAHVLEYTADAPRPSWAYARAVIRRNVAKGINNGMEFLDSVGRLYGPDGRP